MHDGNDDTTIGKGGWVLVVLSGIVSLFVLRGVLHYFLVPALLFSAALALIVFLVLHRLARAVNRYEDEEEARRIRKIVPATGEFAVRAAGAEGAAGAVAVPVRPESVTPVPQRPSAVVTPLAKVEAPPVIQPQAAVAAPVPVGPDAGAAEPTHRAKRAAAKPKARAAINPKAEAKPKAEPKAKASAKPKAEKAAKAKQATAGTAPAGPLRLMDPRAGGADDLKEIEGIGPALEKLVNSLGFYHFDQVAGWSEADIALIDAEMKTFKGRIARDKWVEQARIIVTDGLEAFRERARTNNY